MSIGPWFFEENEHAISVNSDRYIRMIQEFFLLILAEMNVGDVWFQQNGTTAHTARVSMNVLRQHFPWRLISLRGDLLWPARSPDFFLWGYLKSQVYNDRPRTLAHLKNNIVEAIANIHTNMLESVEETSDLE